MDEMMQKRSKMGRWVILLSTALSCVFFVYIGVFAPGINLGEVAVASSQKKEEAKSAFDISKVKKPWLESKEMVAHGKGLYAINCAVCHGASGKGDGPAGAALKPKPRNLISGGWKKGGTSMALFKTLTDGLAGGSMASYKHLSAADRWALVQYVRAITKDKPKDDLPKLEAFGKTSK